jgi:lipopolysaccharide/colanic/teichoic acid biosynthesis glycosyltransferase
MYKNFFKKIIDFLFALIGLILLMPLFIVIAILIKREDGGRIFFKQTRVGKNWKLFEIYKFRTMVENAENLGAQITKKDDPRITKVGKILRKYKLDELPQLINVLKGDMSLVGPRPEVPKYAKVYKKDYDEILTVKPGMTDYASLEYIDEERLLKGARNPEEIYINEILPQKINYYKRYLKNINFLTDMKIIIKTILRIIR